MELRGRKDWSEKAVLRHPLMVGDRVDIEGPAGGEATITRVLPRANAVYRSSGDQLQGLGANIDRAIITMSLANPGPRFQFLDRVLASVYAAGVPARIVFSKADLIDPERDEEDVLNVYPQLGYTTVEANLLEEPLSPRKTYHHQLAADCGPGQKGHHHRHAGRGRLWRSPHVAPRDHRKLSRIQNQGGRLRIQRLRTRRKQQRLRRLRNSGRGQRPAAGRAPGQVPEPPCNAGQPGLCGAHQPRGLCQSYGPHPNGKNPPKVERGMRCPFARCRLALSNPILIGTEKRKSLPT
ncbi:MAG: GTPase RsgA [Spirochaetia bacterium]|nr:GTPase RsgA [Spirochaetia bacterium]